MDEKAQNHDFDERHDGPFDQPHPSVTVPRGASIGETAEAVQNASTVAAEEEHRGRTTDQQSPVTPASPRAITPAQKAATMPTDSTTTSPAPPRSIIPGAKSVNVAAEANQSAPSLSTGQSLESPPRKSVQLADFRDMDHHHHHRESLLGGRKSMQSQRPRQSRDFDVRRDGPYGRPSLTMTRRQSSTPGLGGFGSSGEEDEAREESRPNIEMLMDSSRTGTGGSGGEDTTDIPSPTVAFEPEPPPLNYSLWARRWSITLFWGLIVIDCVAMPIGLYFGLWYGTNLTPNIVFSIVTAALGGVSILEYVLRFWRLWKKDSTCRVIGNPPRWYLDWFHWNFSLGWLIIMIELIVGTIPDNPPIRLLAMPVTSMLYAFGTELLVVDALRYFEIPAPCRISSIPKGAQLRPAIYSIIEDVCAVDGSGNTAFREALNRRYEASHVFRAMLRRLGAFWAFGAQGIAVVLTILIFTIHPEAAYVLGWTVPFVWAGIWTIITYYYVKRKLREEKRAWADEIAEKSGVVAPVA